VRNFRILKLHDREGDAYFVTAQNLNDPDVFDVINHFAGTDAGLEAARQYVADVQARNAALGDTER
jgi:hypothetical protein